MYPYRGVGAPPGHRACLARISDRGVYAPSSSLLSQDLQRRVHHDFRTRLRGTPVPRHPQSASPARLAGSLRDNLPEIHHQEPDPARVQSFAGSVARLKEWVTIFKAIPRATDIYQGTFKEALVLRTVINCPSLVEIRRRGGVVMMSPDGVLPDPRVYR